MTSLTWWWTQMNPNELMSTHPSIRAAPFCWVVPRQQYFAHKRDEFQTFGYDETIHQPQPFPSSTAFLKFLGFKANAFRAPDTTPALSMDDSIAAANLVAASIQNDRECYLWYLSFQPTYDLHFRLSWQGAIGVQVHRKQGTPWPCNRPRNADRTSPSPLVVIGLWKESCKLAGERAFKGKTKRQQEHNAISYLHYLLLARPDHVRCYSSTHRRSRSFWGMLHPPIGCLLEPQGALQVIICIHLSPLRRQRFRWQVLYPYEHWLDQRDCRVHHTDQDSFEHTRRLHQYLGLYQFSCDICQESLYHPYSCAFEWTFPRGCWWQGSLCWRISFAEPELVLMKKWFSAPFIEKGCFLA